MKMSSAKWRPFFPEEDELIDQYDAMILSFLYQRLHHTLQT